VTRNVFKKKEKGFKNRMGTTWSRFDDGHVGALSLNMGHLARKFRTACSNGKKYITGEYDGLTSTLAFRA
jgi:hypothetical protein